MTWIQFSLSTRLPVAEQDKAIYAEDQYFLVIAKMNNYIDPRSFLMDSAGKLYDYCPRVSYLGSISLLPHAIRSFTKQDVIDKLGVKKVDELYKTARNHAKELTDFCKTYKYKILVNE